VISQFDYQNDALGRRTQRLDTLANMPQSLTNSFGYNARSEVVAALMGTNEYGYAFDPIGNRLASTNSGESFSYTANELNQYLQVVDGGTFNLGHDGDGNITNDGRRAFMWDGENRLLAVEPLAPTGGARRIRCAYDHMSRRVEKAVDVWDGSDWVANATNRFIWDSWLLVGEYGQQATGVVTNWNVWGLDLSGSLQGAGGIGGLICRTAGDGVVQHYFMDANGNVSDVTDASGTNILARYLPGPFGEPRLVSGTLDSNPWQFSTKYWDSETGLGYWGYRYYDPITGRWINRDPIAERGGVNLYVICRNAPMLASDVLGLFGPSIHRDATILWASELGIRDDVATAIGEEDDAVDTAFSAKTFPFTDANWGWHFDRSTGGPDTRLAHASDQYVEAKRFCTATVDMPDQAALRLGRGLHPLQDWVAHGDFNRNRLGEMPNIATAPWVWQFQWAHNWFGDGFNAWEMVDNPDLDAGGANGRATIDVLGNPHPLGNGDTAFSTPFHAGQQRRGLARDKTRELLAEFVVYVIRNAKPCGECRKAFLSLTPAP
jgi:RHS repeat-associated protein